MQLDESSPQGAQFTSTGKDPFMTRSAEGIDPLIYRFVRIDMSVERSSMFASEIMNGSVSWQSMEKPPFGLDARQYFAVKADGQRRSYDVEVGKWPGWFLTGNINSLRVDPADAPCLIKIYSISLVPYEKKSEMP